MFGVFKITAHFGEKNEVRVRMTKDGQELSFATKKAAMDTIIEFQGKGNVYDDAPLVARET